MTLLTMMPMRRKVPFTVSSASPSLGGFDEKYITEMDLA
jgi:hypothetical protein